MNSPTIKEAVEDVQRSNQEFETALDDLKEKVAGGVNQIERYSKAVKNPAVMVTAIVIVGVFFGRLLKMSLSKR